MPYYISKRRFARARFSPIENRVNWSLYVASRAEIEKSIFGHKLNIDLKALLNPVVSSVDKRSCYNPSSENNIYTRQARVCLEVT